MDFILTGFRMCGDARPGPGQVWGIKGGAYQAVLSGNTGRVQRDEPEQRGAGFFSAMQLSGNLITPQHPMKTNSLTLLCAAGLLSILPVAAQVPQALNYQGRVTVNGTAFTGTGQFRFALVDGAGTALWSSHASAFTSVPVSGGLYTVRLGDTSLANMAVVPSSLFSNADLRLRVWFNDGVNGVQQLSPDQRLAPVGYAHRAASVDSVPSSAIAPGSIQPSQLAPSAQVGYQQMEEIPESGGTIAVTFPQPFEAAPGVTVDGVPVPAANVTPTGFTLTVPVHGLVLDDGAPTANSVAKWIDMILVGGNPAIAYSEDTKGDLKYVRASNPAGSAWDAPITVVTGGASVAGPWCSMAMVNGNPAIAYYDETNKDLKYVRATNATGSVWGAPVTVASHPTNDLGQGCRLKTFTVSAGSDRPVIAYLDATAGTVRMAVSTNTTGSAWGSPQTPDVTLAGFTDPRGMDMDVTPGGLPVIVYYHPASDQMRLVRSTGILGGGWEAPASINFGKVNNVDLFINGGNQALKYSDTSGTYTSYNIGSSLIREVICGAVPCSRIVEGTYPLAVFESATWSRLEWSAAGNELGYYWSPARMFSTLVLSTSNTIAAVRLTDGSVLAAYKSLTNNGQLAVSNIAAPPFGSWTAGIPAPIVATALAPHAIRLEDLPDDLFGTQNYAAAYDAFAIGRNCKALGEYSMALGLGNTAGEQSFAGGSNNIAGSHCTALGSSNRAMGDYATALGLQNQALGRLSTVMGFDAEARGDYSFAAGMYTVAETSAEISIGSRPTPNTGSATTWVSTDRLFEIGNGQYFTGSNSNALTILKDGRVGLGSIDDDADMTHRFTLPNSATPATGQARANAWTTYSDSRIKTEQRPIAYGLNEIMRLQPRAYTQHSGCVEHGKFKCEDEKGGSAATIGFIAQEVEQVIPEAVQKPKDPENQLYGMSYEKLIPVLVRAAQELKTENDTLKAQMAAIQLRLERLEHPTRKR
jgi:hypothetical protein